MPFLDHLEELRWRIIRSLIGVVIGLVIGAVFSFGYDVIGLLQEPLLPYLNGRRLVITGVMDAFTIKLQIAFIIGLVFAAPVIGYQVWAFLAPALHQQEKRVVMPVLFVAGLLFAGGVALAWYFVLPLTLKWATGMAGTSLEVMYVAREYFGFVTMLALAFGIAFEVPLLLVALSALGILSANTLNRSRKFAVIVIFVASALLSPGDAIIATIAMAIPLYLLYELSVVFAFVMEKRRRLAKEREDAETGTPE
jgi:sec-independent protein translocase protein TatC